MGSRGRPKTQDVLTPREYEVLALLRGGLTNREIADRLGISLAGAKFHVSEIIGKLGVESRDEAAAWQREPSRRWSFAPFAGLREWWAEGASTALSLKVATAVVVPVMAIGIGIGVLVATDANSGSGDLVAVAQSPAPNDACAGRPDCFVIKPRRFSTIEEATAIASFVPIMPGALPGGYERHSVLYWRVDVGTTQAEDPQAVHNDSITVVYRDAGGNDLVISQGFPAAHSMFTGAPQHGAHRFGDYGTVELSERMGEWAEQVPINGMLGEDQTPSLVLSFNVGRFGTGWAIDQQGSYFSGSPMSYSIASDALSLEELVEIAESVDLPEMLAPLGDATPPSGY